MQKRLLAHRVGRIERLRERRSDSRHPVALLFFGPKRLPEIGGAVGRAYTEFKKSLADVGPPATIWASVDRLAARHSSSRACARKQ